MCPADKSFASLGAHLLLFALIAFNSSAFAPNQRDSPWLLTRVCQSVVCLAVFVGVPVPPIAGKMQMFGQW